MNVQTYLPQLKVLLTALNLHHVYEYVAANNPANNLPYHNLFHTVCMTLSCLSGAAVAKLSEFDTKALVVGALFHDYDHSGGALPDAENIKRAKEALQLAASALNLPADLVLRALQFVSSTQYPPVAPAQDEAERIIRDGDMCQMLYEHWFEQVYMGLRTEMAHTKSLMSLEQFCAMQRSFFGGVQLHSKWGEANQDTLRARALAGIEISERAVEMMAESGLSELEAYAFAQGERRA